MTNSNKILIWPLGALAAAVIFLTSAIAVFAASPAIVASGGTTPYATTMVSGTGFGASEPVHVSFGLNSYDTNTDASGAFSAVPIVVPNVSSGMYIIIAVGQHTGTVAFTYIYVSSFYPVASPSGWYVSPGSTITFSGSGFAPNEPVTVSDAGGEIASFTADSSGAFSAQGATVIPYSAHGGSLSYSVHGTQSGATIPLTIGVSNLYPWVNPSSWYITPGNTVTFSGGGYGGGEGISVYYGTNTSPVAHITADASGNFAAQGQVTIPYGSGTAPYRLVGDASTAEADAPITRAAFYPWLTPSAYYSAPGGVITMAGHGFAPDEDIAITSGAASVGTAHTDATGAFAGASVHLPTTPNTTATLAATGQKSGAVAQTGIAIGSYYTWMGLSVWWAQGGSALTITGHNFAAGEQVTASSGTQSLGSGTADNSGDVTITTTVPHGAPGTAPITLTGMTSGAPASVNMTIAPVWTSFTIPPYYGAPGSAVHLVGGGYQPGEQVAITTDRTGTTPVATLTADSNGSFDDSSWHLPADFAEGNLTITATGGWTGDTKSIVYYVTGH